MQPQEQGSRLQVAVLLLLLLLLILGQLLLLLLRLLLQAHKCSALSCHSQQQ
jgi:hypothetical protein